MPKNSVYLFHLPRVALVEVCKKSNENIRIHLFLQTVYSPICVPPFKFTFSLNNSAIDNFSLSAHLFRVLHSLTSTWCSLLSPFGSFSLNISSSLQKIPGLEINSFIVLYEKQHSTLSFVRSA